jgi:N-acetyl-anhydromuramyl-L-alanine amidase AmpD
MLPVTSPVHTRPLSFLPAAGRWLLALGVAGHMTACAALRHQEAASVSEAPVPEASLPLISEPPLKLPAIGALWSPNFNSRKGAGITAIVLHHTASSGDARSIARYFQDHQAKVSAHYVIDRDGSIIRCVSDDKRAWHAGPSRFAGEGNVNDFSLGIEICNRGDGLESYPPEQMTAVARLVAHLADRYRIPLERVTRHRDVALPHGIKIDPSDNFDFEGCIRRARHLLDDQALWLAQRQDRRAARLSVAEGG